MKFTLNNIIKITACFIAILTGMPGNAVFASSDTRIVRGYVAARGYPTVEVKTEDGTNKYIPRICLYDNLGHATIIEDHKADEVNIMSADDYQFYLDQYSALKGKWGEDNLVVEDADKFTYQHLKSDTLYVVYLNSKNNEVPVLLMESPVYLEYSYSLEGYESLLVDKQSGGILDKKIENFGYCSAYYLDNGSYKFAKEGGVKSFAGFDSGSHILVNPVECAIRTGHVNSATDSTGKYTLLYLLPTCLGFDVKIPGTVAAYVGYQVFNPKKSILPQNICDL